MLKKCGSGESLIGERYRILEGFDRMINQFDKVDDYFDRMVNHIEEMKEIKTRICSVSMY